MSASTTTEFLRLVPVLSGLDDELLSRLASEVTETEVRAGEWLMRRGDESDSLYLIRSGQLEVDEGPNGDGDPHTSPGRRARRAGTPHPAGSLSISPGQAGLPAARAGEGQVRVPDHRLGRPVRRYLTGTEAHVPQLAETIVRTVTVGSPLHFVAEEARAEVRG